MIIQIALSSQFVDLQRESLARLVPVEVSRSTFLHDDQGLHDSKESTCRANQDSGVYFGCLSQPQPRS